MVIWLITSKISRQAAAAAAAATTTAAITIAIFYVVFSFIKRCQTCNCNQKCWYYASAHTHAHTRSHAIVELALSDFSIELVCLLSLGDKLFQCAFFVSFLFQLNLFFQPLPLLLVSSFDEQFYFSVRLLMPNYESRWIFIHRRNWVMIYLWFD